MIDTGADMDPVTARARFQFVELGEAGADKAGGSRASAYVLFRNALREAARAAAVMRTPIGGVGRTPDERDARSSAIRTNRAVYGPMRGAARTCC